MKFANIWLIGVVSACLTLLHTPAADAAADLPTLLCTGKNDSAPVYLFKDALGELTRMEVTSGKDGAYKSEYIKVSQEELLAECANGMSVAALPSRPIDSQKAGVPTQSSLPSSFTIMTSTTIACKYGQPPPECRRSLWGNFWVPGSMPSNHTAHLVQYDLAQSGFNNSSSGTHFANIVLTASNSSFTTDFQGKGMIIGVANDCGGAYSSIVQTWQNNPNIKLTPGPGPGATNISRVWGLGAPVNTCYSMNTTSNYRFLVGANRDQATVYWVYPNGSTTPTILPYVPNKEQFFWSSQDWGSGTNAGYPNPYASYSFSGTGAAGVTFLVATFGPIPSSEIWSLTFTNVTSNTQP